MLASVSQFVIAATAVFAYFYTVQPIYQKEKLAEEAARLEIQITQLSIERAEIKNETDTARQLLDETTAVLDKIYYKLYLEGVEFCALLGGIDSKVIKDEADIKDESDISLIGKDLLSPYEAIASCLSGGIQPFASLETIPASVKEGYKQKIFMKLKAREPLKTPTPLAADSIKEAIVRRDQQINNAQKTGDYNAEASANRDFFQKMLSLKDERLKKDRDRVSSFLGGM